MLAFLIQHLSHSEQKQKPLELKFSLKGLSGQKSDADDKKCFQNQSGKFESSTQSIRLIFPNAF